MAEPRIDYSPTAYEARYLNRIGSHEFDLWERFFEGGNRQSKSFAGKGMDVLRRDFSRQRRGLDGKEDSPAYLYEIFAGIDDMIIRTFGSGKRFTETSRIEERLSRAGYDPRAWNAYQTSFSRTMGMIHLDLNNETPGLRLVQDLEIYRGIAQHPSAQETRIKVSRNGLNFNSSDTTYPLPRRVGLAYGRRTGLHIATGYDFTTTFSLRENHGRADAMRATFQDPRILRLIRLGILRGEFSEGTDPNPPAEGIDLPLKLVVCNQVFASDEDKARTEYDGLVEVDMARARAGAYFALQFLTSKMDAHNWSDYFEPVA